MSIFDDQEMLEMDLKGQDSPNEDADKPSQSNTAASTATFIFQLLRCLRYS